MDWSRAQIFVHNFAHLILTHLIAHIHHRKDKLLLAYHAVFVRVEHLQRIDDVLNYICVVAT